MGTSHLSRPRTRAILTVYQRARRRSEQRDKTALHLEAVQTVDLAEQQNLLDFYAQAIVTRAEQLLLLNNHLVVDAYFAAGSFIDQMVAAGFEVTTRLRKNARLRYLYIGPNTPSMPHPFPWPTSKPSTPMTYCWIELLSCVASTW